MAKNARSTVVVMLVLAAIASCGRDVAAPGRARTGGGPRLGAGVVEIELKPDFRPAAGQTIYVPVYSRVHTSTDARPFELAVTLSIRNTDRANPLVVTSIRYHDQSGRLVRDALKKSLKIDPLAATELFVDESDTAGGASASFLVEWAAEQPVSAPVVESVMIGTASTQGISFACPGRVVAERHASE